MPVALLDLKPHHCRWPLDEGGFCGCRKVRGAYCEEHANRAYKTPPATTAGGAPDQVEPHW